MNHMNMTMDMGGRGAAGDHSYLTVGSDHSLGIVALLFFPPLLVLGLALIERLAARSAVLTAVRSRIAGTGSSTLLAALLMLVTGVIHLVLVPTHLEEDPSRAALFVINGAAFLIAAGASFTTLRWRGPAAVLLVATIAVYGIYVLSGREDLDALGLLAKTVEGLALVAIALSKRTPQHSIALQQGAGRSATQAN